MRSLLYQDVEVPAGAASLTLEWKDRVQWDLLNYAIGTQNRTYQVQIVDPGTLTVLQVVHSLTAATATFGDTGWIFHSVDVSAYLARPSA